MLSFKEFMNKTNGKAIAVPWGFSGECVSLVNVGLNEMFGYQLKRRGNAVDWWVNLINEGIADRVTTPKAGDIVVWGTSVGAGYGHVAFYVDRNNVFDQNRLGDRTAKVRRTLSTRPLGYLRMRRIPKEDSKKLSFDEVVAKANSGAYGNNPGRKRKILEAGHDYTKVQAAINALRKGTPVKPATPGTSVKVGAKVFTTATKDGDGVKLDGRSVFPEREFTIQQVSKNGKEVLLKEVSTWVFVNTLTGKGTSTPVKTVVGQFANMSGWTRLFKQENRDATYPNGDNKKTNLAARSAKILATGNGRVKVNVPSFSPQTVWVANSEISISSKAKSKVY